MKQIFFLLAFFGLVTISSVSAQSQNAIRPKQEATTTDAQSITAQKAANEASMVKHVPHKKESFSKVQYCSKSGKAVSSSSSWKADCIKPKANCSTNSAALNAAFLKNRTNSCSPAQRAACTSANAKSAAIKKAQKSKA